MVGSLLIKKLGKITSDRAIKILLEHGVKAKVDKGKIKALVQEVKPGKTPVKERTFSKVETLDENPTLEKVRDFLGYKKGGSVLARGSKFYKLRPTKLF